MIQSPSKFMPRKFLRSLIENNFISSQGIEYDEHEVRELLTEKETSLALSDYANDLIALESGEFEGSKNTCQALPRCELFSANIIFPLPVNYSFGEVISATVTHQQSSAAPSVMSEGVAIAAKRGKMLKTKGKVLTEKQMQAELADIDQWIKAEMKEANDYVAEIEAEAKAYYAKLKKKK